MSKKANGMFSWVERPSARVAATLFIVSVIGFITITMGGILFQAFIITLCSYIGILITLNRMRKPLPADAGKFRRILTAPFRAFGSFFFRHRLITTIAIGLTATALIGFGSVTGIAVAALSVLLGDIVVSSFIDVADWVRGQTKQLTEEVKYVEVVVA